MAPAKFDDLSKKANDVLSDDFKDNGQALKIKSKTNFEGLNDIYAFGDRGKTEGATLTTAVDFDYGGKCATPAKVTLKFPKPLGFSGIAFDKLEFDKSGKMKLESTVDLAKFSVPDCKVECKSELMTWDGMKLGCTYSGIKHALFKAEIEATNPGNYMADAAYAVPCIGVSVAVKSTPKSTLDVGVNYAKGPTFLSAAATEAFEAFALHGFYKVSDDMKVACNYNLGGKDNGKFTAGIAYDLSAGTLVKGKLNGKGGADLSISTSVKQDLAKGVSVTAGSNVRLDNSKWTWGMSFNVE